MDNSKNILNFYNRIYANFQPGNKNSCCSNSISNLGYANKLVNRICKTFHLPSSLKNKKLIDIGCGLGYISEAFRLKGAQVTAIDMSWAAISKVRSIFPNIHTLLGSFPEEALKYKTKFDIIFSRDLSILSTDKFEDMCKIFFEPASKLLNKDGYIICGYRSNFSGQTDAGNWANWPYAVICGLKDRFNIIGPKLINFNLTVNPFLASFCKKCKIKIPFYFLIKHKPD